MPRKVSHDLSNKAISLLNIMFDANFNSDNDSGSDSDISSNATIFSIDKCLNKTRKNKNKMYLI
jgi:hypothetical protein